MKNNKDSGAFLILAGILILSVFTYISAKSMLPNNSSSSFFSKDNNELNANIDDIKIRNKKLVINTSDDVYVCVKQTKTKPNKNSLCWKKVENNEIEISIYIGKIYYIWIMDNENNISNYIQYNTNINELVYE